MSCPPRPGGGILNGDDRDELAQRGVELAPAGMDRMGIELQNLYAALAQPRLGLTVSYPAADVAGASCALPCGGTAADAVPTPAGGKGERRPGVPPGGPAPGAGDGGQRPGGTLWNYFAGNPAFSRRLEAMERASRLRRGTLSPGAVRALYGERAAMSASRLERMRSCHFAYFMEYGLRAKPRTPAAFDAPQIGTFLHYLLENVTRDVLAQGALPGWSGRSSAPWCGGTSRNTPPRSCRTWRVRAPGSGISSPGCGTRPMPWWSRWQRSCGTRISSSGV